MRVRPSAVPVFLLAGGLGTRISEESHLIPKPMIEVGEVPILLHIMRWYYAHGFTTFVICSGYRSWVIKEYFLSYEFRRNHLVVDHRVTAQRPPYVLKHRSDQEKWQVHVVDTGLMSMTGARLARALDDVSLSLDFEHFAVTYGDGLCDVNLVRELNFHVGHGQVGTVLGVPPPARFGELNVDQQQTVCGFIEKPQDRQSLINGGYFFFKRSFRDYLIGSEDCVLEHAPLEKLAYERSLKVFPHRSFWQPMDTLRDKHVLQKIWKGGQAPWAASKAANYSQNLSVPMAEQELGQ